MADKITLQITLEKNLQIILVKHDYSKKGIKGKNIIKNLTKNLREYEKIARLIPICARLK